MTTPQNPYGEQPPEQPPGQPANPYGPPGEAGTPPSPQNPYGATPPPPPDPGQQPGGPGQPTYGQNPYGGTPPPGYGGPAYPGGPQQEEPSKGLAIVALVTAFLGCTCIGAIASIVMSVIVLRRSRDGRNHGKGLAISAIVISLLSLAAGVVAGAVIGVLANYASIDELETGQCITAEGLSGSGNSVTEITKVSCSDEHDGEIMATVDLTAEQAEGYGDASSRQLCFDAITAEGTLEGITDEVSVIGLTSSSSPDAGDRLACVAFNTDGSQRTGKLG
ncbi:DUF4190 domain-containing protein [Nocardioides sp. SYSU D00038]|uniref:DUF4190 domain-containing protein n=1 Tax=Nocardioides sp. SYSU D00038 TaxID=2812554 RepID=UPI001967A67B|nr:DUF4190 domain-containing protein [Nocardioides sp. SYSU D00038]